MKSIETKYHGPSNVRGSCYSASDGDNRIIVSADDRLSSDANHQAVAFALCVKLHWQCTMIGGHSKNGMVWVHAPDGKIDRFVPMFSVRK